MPYADENQLVLQMTYLILQAINFNQHLLTLFSSDPLFGAWFLTDVFMQANDTSGGNV